MTNRRHLSRFEWFSLVTGVIGLVANGLYLATFAPSQSDVGHVSSSVVSWMLLFGLLCYSVVVLDVLAIKLFQRFSTDEEASVRAFVAVEILVGVPPLAAYFIASARLLLRHDPLALVNLSKSPDYTPTMLEANFDWVIQSIMLAALFSTLLGLAAVAIAQATTSRRRR